ncbi:response regulator [Candidatus Parcubacteria bacterium]|nr:MAG: response regulator [Candidatus Parcubacteria bacterium]
MAKRKEGMTGQSERSHGKDAERAILVVEDDSLLADLLERKLKQEGFVCHVAVNTREAAQILGTERIDLILLDLVLPGVDGISYLKKLKADSAHRDIPVIIISNLLQEEEIRRGKAAGAVDYITKASTTPQGIVRRVRSFFKKQHTRRAA